MGRDDYDWSVVDAMPNSPVRFGLGWGRTNPPGHDFVELPNSTWDQLSDAAFKQDVILFERLLTKSPDAFKMYSQVSGDHKEAIRAAFSAVRRR